MYFIIAATHATISSYPNSHGVRHFQFIIYNNQLHLIWPMRNFNHYCIFHAKHSRTRTWFCTQKKRELQHGCYKFFITHVFFNKSFIFFCLSKSQPFLVARVRWHPSSYIFPLLSFFWMCNCFKLITYLIQSYIDYNQLNVIGYK